MISFKEELEFGEKGEKIMADILIELGYAVMPLFQFESNSAPYLMTDKNPVILPDLMCYKGDQKFFCEVKTKTSGVGSDGNLETGFNRKNYTHYAKIHELTGIDITIAFIHTTDHPGIYIIPYHKYFRIWDGKCGSIKYQPPMVFYRKCDLTKIQQR